MGAVGEVTARCRLRRRASGGGCAQVGDGAGEQDLAALAAGAGSEIHDVIGELDNFRLVLDDEDGVALVAQREQQAAEPRDVVRVKASGRLVEDVGGIRERRGEVSHHAGTLRLATRQRARWAVEREIT